MTVMNRTILFTIISLLCAMTLPVQANAQEGKITIKGKVDIETKKMLPINLVFDHRIGAFNDTMPFVRKLEEIFANPEVIREW